MCSSEDSPTAPDRSRVSASYEYLARRQQFDLMPSAAEYVRPMVCAAASLHHYQHRPQLCEVLGKLVPRQLLAADLAGLYTRGATASTS